jgi:enoyl-CoA hydratase/carnithine racemase
LGRYRTPPRRPAALYHHHRRPPNAQAWGLLERVVPRDEFELVWRKLAGTIADSPRGALVSIKQVLRNHRPAVHPATADHATSVFADTWVSDDHWRMVEEMDAKRRAAKG